MRIIAVVVPVVAVIMILAAVGLASNPSPGPTANSAPTPTAEDTCLTTYLTASSAATAALARADSEVARSLDGLLAANDDASARPAIATATAARIAYNDATAALADATTAFTKCATE